MIRSSARALSVLVAGLLVGACSAGSGDDAPGSVARDAGATTAEVDVDLPTRSISVRGTAEVGSPLTAVIAPDLEGRIVSWGWHRCIEVPACQTIPDADGPSYTPTLDDAWHVLRVIAVAERDDRSPGAVQDVVGPVVNPDPSPVTYELTLDPSRMAGTRVVVGPGPLTISIDAGCPVQLVAGVKTPQGSDAVVTAEHSQEEPATRHDVHLDSDGGELLVALVGDCPDADATVEARR